MKCCTALIVLNYNDYGTTSLFVKQVRNYSVIDKIVIVDNQSTDGSYNILKNLEDEKVELIQTQSNGGYASGNNYGAFYAMENYKPEYLIIANPDIKIEEKSIKEMIEKGRSLDKLGIMSCKMICSSGVKLPIAWKLPNFWDCLKENFIILSKLTGNKLEYPITYYDQEIKKVDAVPGSFFIISAEAFCDVGGFDPNTFLYYEENILGFRLKERGYINYLFYQKTYDHLHSVSINKSFSSAQKRLEISQKSRKYYCDKYLRINKLQKALLDASFVIGIMNYKVACWLLRK